MQTEKLFRVGEYIELFNQMTGQALPCGAIYQSHGLAKHIQKRHAGENEHLNDIPAIIQNPDYIGKHPKEKNSIELVKVLHQNVMVCIKLDLDENYLFVASVFEITEAKLRNRINSGRLKRIDN
ncbi:PBECR2 nuclease fold domain-containing protein [Candidatus Avoscillospira sp. LCP25S3_F1]|uniref:PBECR3 domain-containing polyvalent protein n=1 Tax=Candidatus Avoscillospira sp. LCP25S3_F1 TaxID=3438825 RepID=UPI003F9069FB